MTKLKVALAQVNPTVGDISGNLGLIVEKIRGACEAGAHLIAFPEMVTTGYPPLDLLPPKQSLTADGKLPQACMEFVERNRDGVRQVAQVSKDIASVVGFVDFDGHLRNAAALIAGGGVVGVVYKTLLPTYDVFDEHRYFTPADLNRPLAADLAGERVGLGISVCEDIWDEELGYGVELTRSLAENGAAIVVSINASPFYTGKRLIREKVLRGKAKKYGVPILYVNMVGGQDELVFDGGSFAVDRRGEIIAYGKQFEEDLVLFEIDLGGTGPPITPPPYREEEEDFKALVLGVRDYFRKAGFKKAVIGLSGGIDSSLTAAIATEALGPENVVGVSMPSRYTSEASTSDAKRLADNLKITLRAIPIEEVFESYEHALADEFAGTEPSVAEENVQARIRGDILMALSNKFGHLVLSTGNKTELALGYCTLYGDMTGGIAVIGDVSKMKVYKLARYYNERRGFQAIPADCFKKIPSAELRPNQTDPFDYGVVSPLADEIIENRRSRAELIKLGYDPAIVGDVLNRIRSAEYKRSQAPPTIKITAKAFGMGWKMPLVNKFMP